MYVCMGYTYARTCDITDNDDITDSDDITDKDDIMHAYMHSV